MNTDTQPDLDINAVFRRLRAFDQSLIAGKANKHDRAHMLINACISEGIDTGTRITGALEKLGLNRQHVGIRLTEGIQNEPEWPNWGRRDDGTYYAPPRPTPDV